jgi:hypothetical protein
MNYLPMSLMLADASYSDQLHERADEDILALAEKLEVDYTSFKAFKDKK